LETDEVSFSNIHAVKARELKKRQAADFDIQPANGSLQYAVIL